MSGTKLEKWNYQAIKNLITYQTVFMQIMSVTDKQKSTPVVRTGVYTHMPTAVTTVVKDTFGSVFSNTRYKILCMYSCRIFYDSSRHRLRHRPSSRNTNSLQHWPATTMRRLVSHTVRDGRGSLSHRPSTLERVIAFSIDLGGLPLGQRSPKGEMTYYLPRSTILQNFSPIP